MKNKKLISKELEDFYNKASEETRLEKGMGIFEFERIKDLIAQHISISNTTIIDIGGGTGKYSEWLAKKGHTVHLIEPVLKHIKLAEKRAKKLQNPFTVAIGEAKNLPYKDNTADLVIFPEGQTYIQTYIQTYVNLLNYRVGCRHTDKSRSSRYRDIGNLAIAIAISGK